MIEYPLHSLFGRQLDGCRRLRRGGVLYSEVLLDEWCTLIPELMARREECAQLRAASIQFARYRPCVKLDQLAL